MNIKKKLVILILLIILLSFLLVFLDSPYLHIFDESGFSINKFDGNNSSSVSDDRKVSFNKLRSSSDKTNLSIVVTGDIMFGRKMPGVLSSSESPYRYVSNVTGQSDILLINTENPFTTSSSAVKGDVPLKANPKYIPLLNGTEGIVISANANNHLFDYGVQGMRDSISNLNNAGIKNIGVGENKQEASEPAIVEKNGYKIVIFNYMDSDNFKEYSQEVMPIATDTTPGYSAWDSVESPKQISEAKENGADFVLVYMHYGNEYSRSPNDMQKNISHTSIDAGADAVVGAHAHVTQGVELYNGKPIYYNLGNFMFDQSNSATHRAYIVQFNLTEDNVTSTLYPVNIINYLPHFMDSDNANILINELNPNCDEMVVSDDGTGKIQYTLDTN